MPIVKVQGSPHQFNVAIVASKFNEEITTKLVEGALNRLNEYGFDKERITLCWVPGAVEIPLTAQRLARTEKYEVIICLGVVIQGETRHFDYVCEQVSQGCQQVSLSHDIPIIFGVLTTENFQQALDRAGGKYGNKGSESVDAALDLLSVLTQI